MFDAFRDRMSKRYQFVKERDEKWVMRLDLGRLNRILTVLFATLVVLNLVDVLSTLAAISNGPIFAELNPLASGLFQLGFPGFMLALAFKYLPMIPIAYGVFMPDSNTRAVQVRSVKLAILVVLGAANIFYFAVAVNNLTTLAAVFF